MEILIVEDSPTQVEKLRSLLQKHGYQVRAAGHGKQALELIEQKRPDLVLSDILMPEMDGYELCCRIKSDASMKEIPVLLVTSLSDPQDVLKGLECGADGFILKPYEEHHLLSRIRSIWENSASRKLKEKEEQLELFFEGRKYRVNTSTSRTLHMLLSTFALAMQRNSGLARAEKKLRELNDRLEQQVEERTADLRKAVEEQQRAANTLQEHEAVLRSFFDSPGALRGIVEVVNGDILHIEDNEHTARFLGRSRESARNRSAIEMGVPEDDVRLWISHYEESRRTGQPVSFEYCHAAGGETKWFMATVNYLGPGRQGNHRYAYVAIDWTQRRLAEDALRESEARFQNAFRHAPIGMALVSPEGRFVKVNPSFCRMLGYTEEDLLGRDFQSITHPDDLGVDLEYVGKMISGEIRTYSLEKRYLHREGHPIWAYLSVSAVKDGDDRIEYFLAQVQDTTQRKRAEDDLQQQFYWTGVLNSLSKAITQRNSVGSILRVVMRHLEDSFRFELGGICLLREDRRTSTIEVLSRRGSELASRLSLHEGKEITADQSQLIDGLPSHQASIIETAEIEATQRTDESRQFLRNLEGSGIGSMVVIPLVIGSKRLGAIFLFYRAVASFGEYQLSFIHGMAEHISMAVQNWKLYEDLERAYTELKRTQQAVMEQERLSAMGQMASGIAHDINNTLAPITLYTEALLESEKGLSDRARRFLQTIQQATRDIESTTTRLRKFYRKAEDREGFKLIAIEGLLEHVVDLTRPRWQSIPQKSGIVIDLQVRADADLPPLQGHESEIREAMINLVFNAVDAMPGGGMITLGARIHTTRLSLDVADTGLGMNEEQKRRCLEPFYTTKGEQGTGLGLSMVYGVMQRHGGEMEIESRPGEGTTVRLLFPLGGDAVQETAPAAEGSSFSALRILCIDDDATVLRSLKDALEIDGHEVETAESGMKGLEAFRSRTDSGQAVDLVITDLGMPHMDGHQVARQIKEASPHTPIILLSGWGKLMFVNGDRPENVDQVLSKPPRIAELRSAIQKLFTGRKR